MTGSVLSQLLPILFSPVTARIYGPGNYGVLGIYMAITAMLTVFSGFGLNTAILIPKELKDAKLVLRSSTTLCTYFSILTLAIILLFRSFITQVLGVPEVYNWLLLAPLTLFVSGIGNTLLIYFNRMAMYKVISTSRVLSAVVTVLLGIGLGLIYPGPWGLIVSLVASQVIAMLYVVIKVPAEDRDMFAPVSWTEIKLQLNIHRNFPLYSLPADFLYALTNQLPIFLLGKLTATPATIGQFNMSNRMLGLPITFIASSFQEVFRQRASTDYANNGNCRAFYLKTLKSLFFLSFIPFLVIILFGQQIFTILFGDRWAGAGIYSQILAIMFWFRFIVMPVNFTFYIAGRQREHLILYVIVLLLTGSAMYIGHLIFNDVKGILLLYAIAYSFMYVVYLVRSYQLSGGMIQQKSPGGNEEIV